MILNMNQIDAYYESYCRILQARHRIGLREEDVASEIKKYRAKKETRKA
jgi:hypothetical protein